MVKTIGLILMALVASGVVWAGEMSVDEWERYNAETAAYMSDYAQQVAAGEMPPIKCGTSIINDLRSTRPKDAVSKAAFTDREDTMSFTYETTHFLLHYTDNGANEIYQFDSQNVVAGVPNFIVESGVIFEEVYQREVDGMGFPAPPFDGTNGGDGRMDVYFINFLAYGATVRDEILPTLPVTATSYMFLENDYDGFAGYESNPTRAVRVTAAHEFLHTIQFGIDVTELEGSGPTQNPAWIEMSATFMEEELYSYVNDYYNYVPFFYAYPQWSLRTGTIQSGTDYTDRRNLHMYGAVVWPIFLAEHFGSSIIKDIWDGCGEKAGPNWWQATDSIIKVRSDDSLDMNDLFREFTLWNLFTGLWADTENYFPEGDEYRLPQFLAPITAYPATITAYNSVELDSLYPDNLGANYVLLRDLPNGIAISFNPDRTHPWGLQVVKFWGGISDSIAIDTTVYDSSTTQIIFENTNELEQIVLIPSVLGANTITQRIDYTINITPLEEGLSRPNGGDELFVGDTYNINWYFGDSVTSVVIEISANSGNSWSLIDTTINDFIYEWEVDTVLANNVIAPSNNCLVRVSDADNPGVFDISDAVFSLGVSVRFIADPYPNPAWVQLHDGVTFKANLGADDPAVGVMEVAVFTVAGEKIREIEEGIVGKETEVLWDFTNDAGTTVAAGVYLAVINIAGQTEVKKFVVLR
ncbi:MAG: hypothetical protein GY841_17385 [FCB group bacterium]|nr:hypothetical protein [FCB group bacterium]